MRQLRPGRDHEQAQTTAELGILLALCGIALIVAIILFRPTLDSLFNRSGSAADVFKPPATPVCDANYSGGCVPPYPPDVDCADLAAMGISNVTVTDSDPHKLDLEDGVADGVACR